MVSGVASAPEQLNVTPGRGNFTTERLNSRSRGSNHTNGREASTGPTRPAGGHPQTTCPKA
eukprot:1192208-Prorocentrum_minimum.AAC.17